MSGYPSFAAKFHPFRDARRDIELAQAIRREFPDIDLMIDPVCAYTVPDALKVGKVLEALNFYWFENPISDFDLKGLSFLAGKLSVPLSVGEQNFVGFSAMRDYLKTMPSGSAGASSQGLAPADNPLRCPSAAGSMGSPNSGPLSGPTGRHTNPHAARLVL